MRQKKIWMLAAILVVCGMTVLTSCSNALFTLSPRGTVNLTPQAETIFTPSATGNSRYQLPGSAEWNARMLEKIRD